MRRTITMTVVAVAALGLAACGGTADLTQDKAKAALVDAGDLPDGSWSAGEVVTARPPKDAGSSDDLIKNAKGASQACKDAMKGLEEVTPSDAKAYARREYTKGTGDTQQQLQVVVTAYDRAKDAPGKLAAVADTCKTLTLSAGGTDVELGLDSPGLEAEGAKALEMSMDLGGQKMTLITAAAPVGDNLVAVSSQGGDTDAVRTVVDRTLTAQVAKVRKVAG